MNQKWFKSFENGKEKWILVQLSGDQRKTLELKAQLEHNDLMKNCLARAREMLKLVPNNSEYVFVREEVEVATALFNAEVSHTAYVKEEFLEELQAKGKSKEMRE